MVLPGAIAWAPVSSRASERRGDRTLEYRHTFVPESLRRRGIASQLVRYSRAWAAEQGYSVVASCPFVKRYVERNREAAGAVVATAP